MTTTVDEQLELNLAGAPTAARENRTRTSVLHLINGEHYSGAERVQDLLALRLAEQGYDVGFACLRPDRFAALREARQAVVFDVPMRSRFDLRPAWHVARLVRKHGYRLIHSHTPRAALVGRWAAAMAGVPLVHHVHSPTTADSTHKFRNRVNAALERWSLRHAAGVIAVSHSLGKYAAGQGIDEHVLTVVPNGVPTAGPLISRATPTGVWTLGAVALFRERKGLEVLLDALALLRRKLAPVRLRLIGGFETLTYESQIQQQIARLHLGDYVDWVGFTSNVPAELAKLDLMVLPSLFGEGLPMVILEAMAAGVPVVATRVEGVPEAIRDGIDGLLTTPGNAADLAHSIEHVTSGQVDWQALRHSAHRRQADVYSDHSMAASVARVYRQVLQ